MRFLITGARSGLGKHLLEFFDGIPLTRDISQQDFNNLKINGVDIIIHAAFNSDQLVNTNNLYTYTKDNVLLTRELLNIPHQKFIYISTVDVYPKDQKKHRENEVIDISLVRGIYEITKLISESLVRQSSNYLILRCATLIGKYSRKNSLIKIIEKKNPNLTLSPDSSFNYVQHHDVSNFIKLAIKKDLRGIYNLASSTNITLSQVAKLIKKNVRFGKHIYDVGKIDNSKAAALYSHFKKTSRQVVLEFIHRMLISGSVQ